MVELRLERQAAASSQKALYAMLGLYFYLISNRDQWKDFNQKGKMIILSFYTVTLWAV